MKKRFLKKINIDKNWTLFLDRDGVINYKIENDYIKKSISERSILFFWIKESIDFNLKSN